MSNSRRHTPRYLGLRKSKCNYCGSRDYSKLTIDHIVPRVMGGTNSIENLQALCEACHYRKSEIEFAAMIDPCLPYGFYKHDRLRASVP